MKIKMQKKKSSSLSVHKAWNLLRVALFWARKGGILKRRLMVELRGLVPKYLKTQKESANKLRFGERQFSFDETPIFHVGMHRPASLRFLLPCISPQIDFDYDFDAEDDDYVGNSYCNEAEECEKEGSETEIDARAEEFIAKFYEQIKLQRQISYLEYKEEKLNSA